MSSEEDNGYDDLSDESDDISPDWTTSKTRSGRVIKPSKRKDYDLKRLYQPKSLKPLAESRPDNEGSRKPIKIRLKLNNRKNSNRGPEGETTPERVTVPPESPKDAAATEELEPSNSEEIISRANKLGDDDPEAKGISQNKDIDMEDAELMTTLISDAEGINIFEHVKGNYEQDKLFKLIIKSPDQYRNFLYEDGLLFLKSGDSPKRMCIPDVNVGKRRIREIIINYAHTLLAHLSARKTLQYIRKHVWWKGMIADVNSFCESCQVCSSTKSRTSKPYGLLKTLEIANRPWQSIGIDFVGPLPSSTNRHGTFDMICVIIDHLTCLVHLVPTNQKYRARHVAEVVFDTVYKLHGLPERIVSDRDSLFMSLFWSHLHKLIGVELKMSTAYHPQTDGATELIKQWFRC